VSSDAAPAASFSPLFGKTLSHQLLTYPASAQTIVWCKKRVKALPRADTKKSGFTTRQIFQSKTESYPVYLNPDSTASSKGSRLTGRFSGTGKR
jgi:hypothetical protein